MPIITNIEDLRVLHQKRTPKMFYDYADSGSWTESTYRANESDFQKIKLRQRVAVNMLNRTTKTKMIGQDVAMPVALAPTGLTGMQYADGEILAAQAAEKFGVPFCLSTMSICSIEDVAERTTKPFWFQLYVMKNRSDTLAVIKQAKDAGFEALVLTVDTPVAGLRYRDNRNGLTVPPKIRLSTVLSIARKPIWWLNLFTTGKLEFAAFRGWDKPLSELAALIFDPSTDFDDIKWLRTVWDGPIVIKGIQSVADAKAVAKCGVQGIILSNHGGRQFDRGPVPIEILPEVVDAVGKKVEVYIDGGMMSGLDALSAVALGAKAVFIGRAYLYGAMANGEKGVQQVIDLMRREFINGMSLSGSRTIEEVQKNGAQIRSSFHE